MRAGKSRIRLRANQIEIEAGQRLDRAVAGSVVENMNAKVFECLPAQTLQARCDIFATVEGDDVDGNLHHPPRAPAITFVEAPAREG